MAVPAHAPAIEALPHVPTLAADGAGHAPLTGTLPVLENVAGQGTQSRAPRYAAVRSLPVSGQLLAAAHAATTTT